MPMYKFVTSQIKFSSEDGHIRHKEIQKHFPYGKNVRYRVDGETTIVYCSEFPTTGIDCEMTTLPEHGVGDHLRFRILTNATVDQGEKDVAVIGIRNLVKWFQDKATTHGFSVESWEKIIPMGAVFAVKDGKKRTHNSVEFQGRLKVIDADQFNKTLGSLKSEYFGIGRAKYCGFGLLEVIKE